MENSEEPTYDTDSYDEWYASYDVAREDAEREAALAAVKEAELLRDELTAARAEIARLKDLVQLYDGGRPGDQTPVERAQSAGDELPDLDFILGCVGEAKEALEIAAKPHARIEECVNVAYANIVAVTDRYGVGNSTDAAAPVDEAM